MIEIVKFVYLLVSPLQQSRPITKFTEDFDFMAMNEKFNKDEVWGHLGKSKGQLNDDPNEYEDDVLEDDISPGKPEVKVVALLHSCNLSICSLTSIFLSHLCAACICQR